MELRQYSNLLIKWLWLIALCAIVAALAAYSVSRRTTPVYQSTSTLLVSQANSPTDGLSYSDFAFSQQIARTYAQLMTEYPVLEETSRRLGLNGGDDLTRLGVSVSAQPVRDTQLIQLSVESFDPRLAAEMANRLPAVFIEQNQVLQRARYTQTRDDLEKERAKVEADIDSTQQRIDELQRSTVLGRNERAELSRMQNLLRQYETTYSALLNSLEQLRLTEAKTLDNVAITTPARVPASPIRPRTATNVLLATLVGAVLATGIAFLVEYLDDTLRTPEQVRTSLNLPTLGAILRIPTAPDENALVTLDRHRSPAAEGYRVLRTNIQFSSVDKTLRTFLITSASPREGKTTTASNLAVAMAQADQRLILVDTDLRRPTVHKYFGLANATGVTTALLQSDFSMLESYLQATSVPNLRVLTAGPLPPNPSELISSDRMRQLVAYLQTQADIVIFDSPPAMAAADAAVLSTLVDGALLVVNADSTRRDEALRALETLQKVDAHLLGAVLNKLGERSSGYYSYYYYYYTSSARGERRGGHQPRTGWKRWIPETFIKWLPATLQSKL